MKNWRQKKGQTDSQKSVASKQANKQAKECVSVSGSKIYINSITTTTTTTIIISIECVMIKQINFFSMHILCILDQASAATAAAAV